MPSFPATTSPGNRTERRVVHVIYPGVKLLDVTGPLQVFGDAGQFADRFRGYRCLLVSSTGGTIPTDAGPLLETQSTDSTGLQASDVLLVHGGDGVFATARDRALLEWLKREAPAAELYASTCTGAFLLAAAGLLDGHRVVTHWNCCRRLQSEYPSLRVEEDPIYIEDDGVWTSAGVTAGIDLSLAIVERDLGREGTLALARSLVMYARRPGGQAQFSTQIQQQLRDVDSTFENLHDWIERNLDGDLRVERLAEQAHMSPRSFHRKYTAKVGCSPAQAVLRMRVECARRLLEETDEGIPVVARRSGFGTEEHMRRAFQRLLSLSPAGYREKWARPAP